MDTNVNSVLLVLILMISQKVHTATYPTGYETPHGARHATDESTTATLTIRAANTQVPPTTVGPDKVPGTVGVSQSPFGPLPAEN